MASAIHFKKLNCYDLSILLHGTYGVAEFTGFIAGFDVKIDLRPFREELSNVPFEMFRNRMSL